MTWDHSDYFAPSREGVGRSLLRTGLVVAVVVGACAVVWLVFYEAPLLLVRGTSVHDVGERLKLRGDVRTAAVQLLGGVAVAAGAVFTYRTLRINRDYQITERYTRAVEQLGSDRLPIRLGGIFALERIARESRRDHGPIMEVLCAFVRNTEVGVNQTSVLEDVQAAISVVGRRVVAHDRESLLELDISETMMAGANLRRCNLAGAFLLGCDLRSAWLGFAMLDRATLTGSKLSGAWLCGASLREAELSDADLTGADLEDTDVSGADFTGAALGGAKFGRCRYDGFTRWPDGFDWRAAVSDGLTP